MTCIQQQQWNTYHYQWFNHIKYDYLGILCLFSKIFQKDKIYQKNLNYVILQTSFTSIFLPIIFLSPFPPPPPFFPLFYPSFLPLLFFLSFIASSLPPPPFLPFLFWLFFTLLLSWEKIKIVGTFTTKHILFLLIDISLK